MSRLHKNTAYYTNTRATAEKVRQEIDEGLALLNSIDHKIASFFGGRSVEPGNAYYQHCKNLAFKLGRQEFAVLTGGGPGIMHAANSGATEAGTPSIGVRIDLREAEEDAIYTHILPFHFLFARRFIMSIKSEALIFYPGGYGTLDELFEYLVLMQSGITDRVPVICVMKDYWKGLFDWLRNNALEDGLLTNNEADLKLVHLSDDFEEIIDIIKKH